VIYIDEETPLYYSELELPLVHVPRDFEHLCKILQEGFKPSYCIETLSNNERQLKAAFPMISFANLDAESAHRQMQSYGTFHISMKKSWAQRNDFNPVLYLDRYSSYTNALINGFDRLKTLGVHELKMAVNGDATGDRHKLAKLLLDTYAYAKNYDGQLIRQQRLELENYHFGLEREWRMLFKKPGIKPYLMPLELDDIKASNQQISDDRFDFELDDIYCITIEQSWQQNDAEQISLERFGSKKVKFLYNRVRERWSD
jgi:Putative abortive phage resistance protein AbiGi, antitoxin